MKSIKITDIKDLNNVDDYLKDNDFVELVIGDDKRIIAVSNEEFEYLEEIKSFIHEAQELNEDEKNIDNNIKIISNGNVINDNLSFEQYEFIKKQINQVIEKTLKPKPEKLN